MPKMMSVCRLCLVDNAAFNIFSKKNNLELTYRIVACTSLEINPNDNLPKYICSMCRIYVDELYNFRKKCLIADRRLRRHKKLISQGLQSDLYANQSADNEDAEDGGGQDQMLFRQAPNSLDAMQWRKTEAEKLNAELQAFKKNLETACKSELRADLELRIRHELEEMFLSQTKLGCQLKVLDDLYNEVNSFFMRKREEALKSVEFGGTIWDSENRNIKDTSAQGPCNAGATEETQINEQEKDTNNSNNLDFVDTIVNSDNGAQRVKIENTNVISPHNLESHFVNIEPLPMVEINMQNEALKHLSEDFNSYKSHDSSRQRAKKHPATTTTAKAGLCDRPKRVDSLDNLKENNEEVSIRLRLRRPTITSSKAVVQKTSPKQPKKTRVKPFKCLYCKGTFVYKRKLDTHIFKKHIRTWFHRCNLCTRRFHLAESLALHVKTHAANDKK